MSASTKFLHESFEQLEQAKFLHGRRIASGNKNDAMANIGFSIRVIPRKEDDCVRVRSIVLVNLFIRFSTRVLVLEPVIVLNLTDMNRWNYCIGLKKKN